MKSRFKASALGGAEGGGGFIGAGRRRRRGCQGDDANTARAQRWRHGRGLKHGRIGVTGSARLQRRGAKALLWWLRPGRGGAQLCRGRARRPWVHRHALLGRGAEAWRGWCSGAALGPWLGVVVVPSGGRGGEAEARQGTVRVQLWQTIEAEVVGWLGVAPAAATWGATGRKRRRGSLRQRRMWNRVRATAPADEEEETRERRGGRGDQEGRRGAARPS